MFSLFLVLPLIFCDDNSAQNPLICLQTCHIDYFGRVEYRFNFTYAGKFLGENELNMSRLISSNKYPIKPTSPSWLYFIDQNYHYLPLKNIVFNYSKMINFYPASIMINNCEFLTTKTIFLKIVNVYDENITIKDAYTTSRNIIMQQFEPILIEPGHEILFLFSICPTSVKSFACHIMFVTSQGIIPFFITGNVNSSDVQKDYEHPTVFHACSQAQSIFSYRVPFVGFSAILYDIFLFQDPLPLISGRSIEFSLPKKSLNNGMYFTFLHFMTDYLLAARSSPLLYIVSPNFIQPYYPILLIGLVTSPTDSSVISIKLVNPTNSNFKINSATLAKNAPSNIQVEFVAHSMIFTQNSHLDIGYVTVYGNKQGEIDTTLIVKYSEENEDNNEKSVEIPIHASVLYGSFEPNETIINFLQTDNHVHNIHFINNFNVPVVILSVYTDSNLFSVSNFKPTIVFPGCKSEDIAIHFIYKAPSVSFEATLIVETNATNHKIPIHGYNRQLKISTNSSITPTSTKIFLKLGKVFVKSTEEHAFYIHNPNPVDYLVQDFNVTPGLLVTGYWMNNQEAPLRDHYISPRSTDNITLLITFKDIQLSKPRNDTIFIGNGGSFIQIIVQWTPISGSFYLTSTAPFRLTLGNTYHGQLYLNSTYGVTTKLKELYSPYSDILISPLTPFIKPNTSIPVGNFSLTINSHAFQGTSLMDIFNPLLSHEEQSKLWTAHWGNKVSVNIPLFFRFKKNSKIMVHMAYEVVPFFFMDVFKTIGYLLPYVTIHNSVEIRNVLNTSLKLYFHYIKYIKADTESTIIPGNSVKTINYSIIPKFFGVQNFKIPITTNASHPFFIFIKAEVVPPNVTFVDYFGEHVNTVEFISENDIRNHTWIKSIFLKNNGKTDVEIGQIFVRSKLFKITRNCDTILKRNETCRIDINVLLKFLRNPKESYNMSLYVYGQQLDCKLSIKLGNEAMRKLETSRMINFVLIVSFSLALPIFEIYVSLKKQSILSSDIDSRLDNFSKEVERLSVSHKTSIATQAVVKHEEVSSGAWIQATEVHQFITSEAFDFLEEILNSLS